MAGAGNKDNLVKLFLVILLTAVISIVIYNLFLGQKPIFSFGIYYGQSLNINSLITSTLVLAVKLLWLIFVISLVVGIVMVAKGYFFDHKKTNGFFAGAGTEDGYRCPCCGKHLTAEFKFCPNCKASLKDLCSRCGKDLQVGWKSCPWCGTERRQ